MRVKIVKVHNKMYHRALLFMIYLFIFFLLHYNVDAGFVESAEASDSSRLDDDTNHLPQLQSSESTPMALTIHDESLIQSTPILSDEFTPSTSSVGLKDTPPLSPTRLGSSTSFRQGTPLDMVTPLPSAPYSIDDKEKEEDLETSSTGLLSYLIDTLQLSTDKNNTFNLDVQPSKSNGNLTSSLTFLYEPHQESKDVEEALTHNVEYQDELMDISSSKILEDARYPAVVRSSSYEKDIAAVRKTMETADETTTTPLTLVTHTSNEDENSLENPQTSLEANVTPIPRTAKKIEAKEKDTCIENGQDSHKSPTSNSGESLPEPYALVATSGTPVIEFSDNFTVTGLGDNFAEALKPQEIGSKTKRRRLPFGLGSGLRRKGRMRIRKVNSSSLTSSSIQYYPPTQNTSDLQVLLLTTQIPRTQRRYRSTTTTLPTLIFPDPSPPTILPNFFNATIIRNGPYPMSLPSRLDVTPGPQLEKPVNVFTEQITTYFVPSQPYTSTLNFSLPRGQENLKVNLSTSWAEDIVEASNQDKKETPFVKDRDSWEKNYMRLQQNSFNRASSPQVITPKETLTFLNQKEEELSPSQSPIFSKSFHPHELGLGVNPEDSDEIQQHHAHVQADENRVFGLREEKKVPRVEVSINQSKTAQPESVRIRHVTPKTRFHGDVTHKEESSESDEHVLRPGTLHDKINNFEADVKFSEEENEPSKFLPSHPPSPPPMTPTHYDRTKHRVIQLASGQHSSEFIYDFPPLQITEPSTLPHPLDIVSPYPKALLRQHRLSQPQSTTPHQMHYFNSKEFFGYGRGKYATPEKLQKIIFTENDYFHSPPIPKPGIEFPQESRNREPSLGNRRPIYVPKKTLPFDKDFSQRHPPPPFHPPLQPLQPNSQYPPHFLSKEDQHSPLSMPFHSFPPQMHERSQKPLLQQNTRTELISLEPVGTKGKSPFDSAQPHVGGSYHELDKAFYNNLIQSANPSPQRRGPLHSIFPNNSHPPRFYNKIKDLPKTHDFSTSYHKKVSESASQTSTLPMPPPLVSIPTPPSEPHALNQVYSNRHYSPHTHSMGMKSDYEPAPPNPPILKGHPFQYHFEPFIQSPHLFPQEKTELKGRTREGKSKSLSYIDPGQSSPRSSYVSSHRPNHQQSSQEYSEEYYSHHPPINTNPTETNQERYPKLFESAFNKKDGPHSEEVFGHDGNKAHAHDYTGDGLFSNKLSPEELQTLFHGRRHGIHESVKAFQNIMQGQSKPKESPPIFSENAYVLMFPKVEPPTETDTTNSKVNEKEISSAIDDSEVSSNDNPSIKIKTPPKVHPKDQILQALASSHYDKEMEKIMEKKRQPPMPIHTPYGLLVPLRRPDDHWPSKHVKGSPSPYTMPYEGTHEKSVPQLPLKDILHEFAYKGSGSTEVMKVINHPPELVENKFHSYPNNEMSFSEHKPIKTAFPFQGKATLDETMNLKNEKKSTSDKKQSLKTLLKKRLEEMLHDFEVEAKKVKMISKDLTNDERNRNQMFQRQAASSMMSYNVLPSPPSLGQIRTSPPQPSRSSSLFLEQPPNGFFDTLKRFFTFGRSADASSPKHNVPSLPRNHNLTSGRIERHEEERGRRLNEVSPHAFGREGRMPLLRQPYHPDSTSREEESASATKESHLDSAEKLAMEKLVRLLIKRRQGRTTSNAIRISLEKETLPTTTQNPFFTRRPLSFVPSQSMTAVDWTPLSSQHSFSSNQRKTQRYEELLDQMQSEGRSRLSLLPTTQESRLDNLRLREVKGIISS